MSIFSKFRLPDRDDSLFGFLFLLSLLVPLAFDVYNFESFEIIKFGLLLVLLSACGIVFFRRLSFSNLKLRLNKPLLGAMGLFLVLAFLASLNAIDKNWAFFGFYPRFTNGFSFYFLWVFLIFFLAALSFRQVGILVRLLFFTSGLMALWGILQSIGFGYYIGPTSDFFVRAAPSFLGNPDFSSMYVASMIPVGFALWQLALGFKAKIYYALSLFLQIFSIIVFASRGGIVALVAGMLSCLLLGLIYRKNLSKTFIIRLVVVLFVALVLGGTFLNFTRPGTVANSLSLNETNIKLRLNIWSLAIQSIKAKPLLGYGLGNFELVFEQHRNLSLVKNGFFDDPHNLYLYFAVSGGILFLLSFLWLIFYPVFLSIKALRQGSNSDAIFTVGVLGGLAAWLVAAFFTPVAIACYFLAAIFISVLFGQKQNLELNRVKFFPSLGVFVSSVFTILGISFIIAEHLLFGSIMAYNSGEFSKSKALAQAAIVLNPTNSLFYEYLAGSTIRAGGTGQEADRALSNFSAFHKQRSYSYILLANLNYLRLYTNNNVLTYKPLILENVNKAIQLDPDAANNYFLDSQYQLVFGDLPASQKAVEKGLSLNPDNFEALVFLAKLYQYQNNRELFIQTLQKASQIGGADQGLDNLVKLARTAANINSVPFKIRLSVGRLD